MVSRPEVMGVLNCSPNSFFNPAESLDAALLAAEKMVQAGVDILDVGGEATNPNVNIDQAAPTVDEELSRVVPVIEAVARQFPGQQISVDTSKPEVMKAAVEAGATLINDQRALHDPLALTTAVSLNVPVCLMHFFYNGREPGVSSPEVLLASIKTDLQETIDRCLQAGISREHIIVDPGFGAGNYGKNTQENFYLLRHLDSFRELGYPILVGLSRKSMLGEALGGVPPERRLYASIAAATLAGMMGASIIRVHDVAETIDAMKVLQAYWER